MSLPLIRRLFVLLLAVLVTAGMGLSAVQASNMSMDNMTMAGMAKCNDCRTFNDSKGMIACAAPACAAQVGAETPPLMALDLAFLPVRHSVQSHILFGRDTVPDPYSPRTTDIG